MGEGGSVGGSVRLGRWLGVLQPSAIAGSRLRSGCCLLRAFADGKALRRRVRDRACSPTWMTRASSSHISGWSPHCSFPVAVQRVLITGVERHLGDELITEAVDSHVPGGKPDG